MISKTVQDAINAQINAELWSAYLYLSMSMDAEMKGFCGVSNWFYVQWQEEQDHARILQRYMHAQNARVVLQPIEPVQVTWPDLLPMFTDTLNHEQEVTAMIDELMTLAIDDQEYATINRLQWFVDEQVEEESAARDIISTLQIMGDNPLGLYAIDRKLAKRTYQKAEPLLED